MLKQIRKITTKLNNLSLREKIIALGAFVILVYFVFDFLVLSSFESGIKRLKDQMNTEYVQIRQLHDKSNKIIQNAKKSSVKELVQRYQQLSKDLRDIEGDISSHKEKYIPHQELHNLLNLILENNSKITIREFQPQNSSPLSEIASEKFYIIRVNAEYLPFIGYLQRLAAIPWDITWGRANYKVDKYPNATILMTFRLFVTNDNPILTKNTEDKKQAEVKK